MESTDRTALGRDVARMLVVLIDGPKQWHKVLTSRVRAPGKNAGWDDDYLTHILQMATDS